MAAAIAVVTRHGTADVAMSEIAEVADIGRKAAYHQFGDLGTLLLEAALDLVRRELLPDVETLPAGRARALASARHFAQHRVFYRALLTSSSAYPLESGLAQLLWPFTRERLEEVFGGDLSPTMITDLVVHQGGGATAMLKAWLRSPEGQLDPEAFADRMLKVAYFLLPTTDPTPTEDERSGPAGAARDVFGAGPATTTTEQAGLSTRIPLSDQSFGRPR